MEDHNPGSAAGSQADLAGFGFEDLFDSPLEGPRKRERERQAGVVLTRLDRIHRLSRYTKVLRQLSLRPCQLRPEDPEVILHR